MNRIKFEKAPDSEHPVYSGGIVCNESWRSMAVG